jgi:hypothetical protein
MKKLKVLILSISLLLLISLTATAQDCSCSDSFEATVETYERNYSLFMYKVTGQNKHLYEAHTTLMREKANNTDNLLVCKAVLGQWLDFFRDGHTYLSITAKMEVNTEKVSLSEKQFKTDYKSKTYEENPLLGIWQNGGYKVAIIPNAKGSQGKRDFVGVILESTNENWNKNEVKFELNTIFGTSYKANFMMGDHSPRSTKAKQQSTTKLSFDNLSDWTKIWPQIDGNASQNVVESNYNKFHFADLEGIPYLRFPDFFSVDGEHVDSIMKANHEKLIAADFIIIDVRDNRGGNDGTYFPILPYILSGPVQIPNTGYWMSEDNIQQILEDSDLRDKTLEEYTEEERQQYDYLMSFKDSIYFPDPDNYFYSYESDTLFGGPKKVVLLTNNETASSGETFVYRANQSEKVVVYGQNTAGIVDGFNGLSTDIGCFKLTYPSSFRSMDLDKNPIDPYGIAPDVYVDKETDMLAYAIAHMKLLLNK